MSVQPYGYEQQPGAVYPGGHAGPQQNVQVGGNTMSMNNQITIVNQQPQSKIYPQNVRDWTSGLCSCCNDLETCCCGFWCPPCLFCMTVSKMNENCCLCCFGEAAVWAMRAKIRGMMGISGGLCTDCCVAVCCTQLAVCQMHRELKNVGV